MSILVSIGLSICVGVSFFDLLVLADADASKLRKKFWAQPELLVARGCEYNEERGVWGLSSNKLSELDMHACKEIRSQSMINLCPRLG